MSQQILRPNFTKNIHQHYIQKGKSLNIFGAKGVGKSRFIEQILANRDIVRETREQRRALARLVDYGFIVKLFGAEASDSVQYRIFVPLFEKWLIERRNLIEIG